MSALAERLRLVREAWGLSLRAMSLELGLAHSLWGFYESGRTQPGIAALEALAKRKVDMNWLLTGESLHCETAGAAILGVQGDVGVSSVMGALEQKQLKTLGLARLSMAARRGLSISKVKVLETLTQAASPMSMEELKLATSIDRESLAEVILELLQSGHLRPTRDIGGRELYEPASSLHILQAETEADIAQMTLNAIQVIANDVVGGLKTPGRAAMVTGIINLPNIRLFLHDITTRINSYGCHEGGSRCSFIFAATEVQ